VHKFLEIERAFQENASITGISAYVPENCGHIPGNFVSPSENCTDFAGKSASVLEY
jgi:hypothetical protein